VNVNELIARHAASMREAGTALERALWQLLRGGQLGVVFRRQVPLLGFCIVEFLAAGARLVVEVDGPYHATLARRRADTRRDRRLCRAVIARCGSRRPRCSSSQSKHWRRCSRLWPNRVGNAVVAGATSVCSARFTMIDRLARSEAQRAAP
jgi:very-short-patch-repair endonuclease